MLFFRNVVLAILVLNESLELKRRIEKRTGVLCTLFFNQSGHTQLCFSQHFLLAVNSVMLLR